MFSSFLSQFRDSPTERSDPSRRLLLTDPSLNCAAAPWGGGVRWSQGSPLSCNALLSPLSPAAGCSEQVEVHTERRGVIYSPSWPLNYPPGVNCSWRIQGSQGEVITIRYSDCFLCFWDVFTERASQQTECVLVFVTLTWRSRGNVWETGCFWPPPGVERPGCAAPYCLLHSSPPGGAFGSSFTLRPTAPGRPRASACPTSEVRKRRPALWCFSVFTVGQLKKNYFLMRNNNYKH